MELVSSWEQRGIEKGMEVGRQEGRQEGKEELLALLLEQRFSTLPAGITKRLDRLSSAQLDDLGRQIFNITSLADLETWLASR